MATIIYYNPRCATSRAVLDLVLEAGIEPVIVRYMTTPPDHEQMLALLMALDLPPRSLLRTRDKAYTEHGLANSALTDRQLIDAMIAHPQLIERPIVITEAGARICRPAERVLDLLPPRIP